MSQICDDKPPPHPLLQLTQVSVNHRWLDVSVANLTSTGYWVMYLQVVQEAVWPGGALPTAPPTERSQQERDSTRQRALGCLMKILPGPYAHTRQLMCQVTTVMMVEFTDVCACSVCVPRCDLRSVGR